MVRVNVKIGIRSEKPTEVEPGIFAYTYDEKNNIAGVTIEQGFTNEDGNTINANSIIDTRLSFIMSNNISNILSRITYVEYLGIRYKAKSLRIVRPRVEVTLGGVWTAND